MRLIFLISLIAALGSASPNRNELRDVMQYQMPGGFPDGTILTFYFHHKGDENEPESAVINFYDLPKVEIDQVYDITAHLRIDRDWYKPVESASYVNGHWVNSDRQTQPLDQFPYSDGWWRVDVIKHDNHHMNVFFQGYWSGVRYFPKSLDNVISIYVNSPYVDISSVRITMKIPNRNLAPLSVAEFQDIIRDSLDASFRTPFKLISFPNFPVGSHIEMTALLRASGLAKYSTPTLEFRTNKKEHLEQLMIMKILQIWDDNNEELWITYMFERKTGTLCTNYKPNGDLQHLYLKRISQNTVRMRVFYKPVKGEEGIIDCELTLYEGTASFLDGPFDIMSIDGALLFHLDHSIPRTLDTGDN